MAHTKFLNFLAVVSFAVFYISLTAIPANALAVERAHVRRDLNYQHAGIAKKKRGDMAKRCKPRPSSSSSSSKPPSYTPPSDPEKQPSSPPSTTSHPSPPPSPAPAATSHGSSVKVSGKVGLAWSNGEQPSICNFKSGQTGFVYNWKMYKYGDVDVTKCGFEFIPTVWGLKDVNQVSKTLVAGYAKRVFAFNEPDIGGQSNLGVDQAIQLYKQYINPLQYIGYELISPSCTNSPDGVKWIKAFVKGCREQGCKIDAVNTHYYGTDGDDFVRFMDNFVAAFPGDPIWLTEWAAQDYSGKNQQLGLAGITAFLQKTTSYLQNKDEVVAYFWFGAMTSEELGENNVNGLNSLMGGDHKPNNLGKLYLNP